MGRSLTPTYRVEYYDQAKHKRHCAWEGRATDKRLAQWVKDLNYSFMPGGVNVHISHSLRYMPHVHKAKIIRQATGEIVAVYHAPAFEVIS